MTQIETLRTGKWASDLATAEDMAAKVQEIRGYVAMYGWENTNVHPYGYAINIVEFLDGFADYRNYTHMSKQTMLAEINGLIRILNKWIEREEEPKVTIRFLTGKKAGQTKEIPASDAEAYVEIGFAEIV